MIEMLIESVIKPILSAKTLSYEEIIAGPFIREVTALVCSDFPPGGAVP